MCIRDSGTTLHGQQSLDPARLREPMTYYGPTSGAALGLSQASALYGTAARVGVVGLGRERCRAPSSLDSNGGFSKLIRQSCVIRVTGRSLMFRAARPMPK